MTCIIAAHGLFFRFNHLVLTDSKGPKTFGRTDGVFGEYYCLCHKHHSGHQVSLCFLLCTYTIVTHMYLDLGWNVELGPRGCVNWRACIFIWPGLLTAWHLLEGSIQIEALRQQVFRETRKTRRKLQAFPNVDLEAHTSLLL